MNCNALTGAGMSALYGSKSSFIVAADTSAEEHVLGGVYVHHLALGKFALYGNYARRQQALSTLGKRFRRTGVNIEPTLALSIERHPLLAGLEVTEDPDSAECIVMGFDTELTFQKLHDVSYLLLTRPELPYIATNPDLVCPTEFGSVPDCGSVCGMIFNATGKRPVVIGKPSPLMPELAMDKLGVSKEETCVVGDRIYTDVKSGLNAGCVGILVMSGETTYEILAQSPDKPHLVLESARDILEVLKAL